MSVLGNVRPDGSTRSWLSILAGAYVGFPLCLWGGYLFGRAMAWFLGLEKTN
jgi:hypothetical protein